MAFRVSRIHYLRVFIIGLGCLLIMRLFYLQIWYGTKLAAEGLNGRVQEVVMEVARGEILDRYGKPLTNTGKNFSLLVFPSQIKDPGAAADKLAVALGVSRDGLYKKIIDEQRPFKLKRDLDGVTAQKLNALGLTGVIAVSEKMRYGHNALASHVIGYINAADNKGVSGIEGMYDELLRGRQSAYVAALVDASQNIIPGLGYKRVEFTVGTGPSNIVLTLDSEIQKIVETILDKHMLKGAAVILRPSTGEVLAMASRPNFDGNNLGDYLDRDRAPLLNRAIAAYQPGSVFKLVVAAAAMEYGLVKPGDIFYDPGYIDVNSLRFYGWDYERGGRGRINFVEAMAYSSNPVFIQIAQKLGAQRLVEFSHNLGFGQKTKLDFDGEASGNLPPAENMYPGDLANMAIGQGALEATPLQVASLVATIVNDGIKVEPYIVSRYTSEEGITIKQFAPSRGSRIMSRQTAAQLREMMAAVTKYGTGQAAYVDGVGAAGKTGSAETGRMNQNLRSINHAWFAGYAPIDNPKFVVVVFVEDGMSGGDVAAPIFREIVEQAVHVRSY